MESAERRRLPSATKRREGRAAVQAVRRIASLEEHDEVSNLYCNVDVDDEVLADLA